MTFIRDSFKKASFPIFLLLIIALIPPGVISAQVKKTGLPFTFNYSKTQYGASTQNWSITQNNKDFLYFGNNDGLLEFDGQHWKTYPLPAHTIVRSVLAVNDTIFAGSFEEIGYYLPDNEGKLVFKSLTPLIPQPYRAFDEVWKIHKTDLGIIFQSFRYIFIYRNGKVYVTKPHTSFVYAFKVNNQILVVDKGNGLFKLDTDGLTLISNDPVFRDEEIRCILEKSPGTLLIGTFSNGLFTMQNGVVSPWLCQISNELEENVLFSGIALGNDFFAFGTIRNGIYIINNDGLIYQHINRSKGLQNNTVLSLYEDKHKNLWLGLDIGIDYVELNSPLSIFSYKYNVESTYCTIEYEGRLYAGTNQGLYSIESSKLTNNNLDARFELIKGTEGQVWALSKIGNQLFCGHNYGCFIIKGTTAHRISDIQGFWNFIPHNKSDDTLICGTYDGIVVLTNNGDSWKVQNKITGFNESCRSMKQDEDGSLWISHGYRGLFHIILKPGLKEVKQVKLYNKGYGLPDEFPYNVNKINNKILITTRSGVYAFNVVKNKFEPQNNYNQIFRNQQPFISEITKDAEGNFWYFSLSKLGVYRLLEDGSYSNVEIPFYPINKALIPAFENIYIQDSKNIYIGAQSGLIHYDPNFTIDYKVSDPVYLREVTFGKEGNIRKRLNPPASLADSSSKTGQFVADALPYRFNAVTFTFASPGYEQQGQVLFSYRLKGYEKNWSAWDKSNFKEYTSLPEGTYTFEVRAMNAYTSEGNAIAYTFRIYPPFHRSKIAYAIYLLLLLLIIAGNIYFQKKRLEKTRIKAMHNHQKELEEQSLKFREQSLIQEKEIMKLRNETLMNEMNHKNKELANSTLNLVHKNKILTTLRQHLNDLLQKPSDTGHHKHEISLLVKKINKELSSEKHQEAFDAYFDEVHQDFIRRLKEVYPELSPKELRLCAYLKMNLSSKEIAPLMNISVRGLEISRYRLRKKLNLDRNVNLIDFILSF